MNRMNSGFEYVRSAERLTPTVFLLQVWPNVCDERNIRKTVCQLTEIERTFSRDQITGSSSVTQTWWWQTAQRQADAQMPQRHSTVCRFHKAWLKLESQWRRVITGWIGLFREEESFSLNILIIPQRKPRIFSENQDRATAPIGRSGWKCLWGGTEKDLLHFNNLTLSQ